MSEYVDDELEPDKRGRVERHVELCPRCRTVLANLRQTVARLGSLRRSVPPGAETPDQVGERLSPRLAGPGVASRDEAAG